MGLSGNGWAPRMTFLSIFVHCENMENVHEPWGFGGTLFSDKP